LKREAAERAAQENKDAELAAENNHLNK